MRKAKGSIAFATCAMVALLSGLTPRAHADSFGFDIGIGHAAISGFSGPYVHVDVTLTSSTTSTITFTSLTNNGNIYLMGGKDAVDVNVNATSWTIDAISGTNSGTQFSVGPFMNTDGGPVNQTTEDFPRFTRAVDNISFDLTNTSGMWASAADVLAPNANGVMAAAHILVTSFPANAANGFTATGFATDRVDPSIVSEPSSLTLYGLGILALGITTRRYLLPIAEDSKERLAA